MFFCGGIFYGDVYIYPHINIFFGPAVSTAYKLESTIAVHPRIVIDNFVAETVIENILQVKHRMAAQNPQYIPLVGMGLMPQMPETGNEIVEKDIDTVVFQLPASSRKQYSLTKLLFLLSSVFRGFNAVLL